MLAGPHSLTVLLGFLLVSAVLLGWGFLPPRARRVLSLGASVAALVFLIVALNTAGHREAETVGSFVLGSSYVAGHASASASLRFYVMTAVCLLLGTIGLAIPERAAARLAEHWLATAVGLTVAATALRFA